MFLSYCFFQIDKQLASGEYFMQEKERKLKAWQGKKVILVPPVGGTYRGISHEKTPFCSV